MSATIPTTDQPATKRARIEQSGADAPLQVVAAGTRVTIDARPDFDMARRWARGLRHVHHVEIRHDDTLSATIHGIGHRSPTVRPISLSTALAFALTNTPLVLAHGSEAGR